MDYYESVPVSIWEKILQEPVIKAVDLLSFTSTCKRFYDIRTNPIIWRTKFLQKWPSLKAYFVNNNPTTIWFDIYQNRQLVALQTKNMLDNLSVRFVHEQEELRISDSAYVEFLQFMNLSEYNKLFLMDELRYILNEVPKHTRLTNKYYANGTIRYLQKQLLLPKWQQWLDGDQLLETGAWMIAQWFQPNMYLDEATSTTFFDSMVRQTKEKLSQTNKHHSLLQSDLIIDHASLRETMWTPSETRQIIDALSFVFCTVNGFQGNSNDYYNLKNSFLNEVIKRKLGIPITLCILFHAIARRLGVYCEPVNFPGHFLLRFVDHPEFPDSKKYTYIDVFNSCLLKRRDQLWNSLPAPVDADAETEVFPVASPVRVMKRMLQNIMSQFQGLLDYYSLVIQMDALELCDVLVPTDFNLRVTLVQIYFHCNINTTEALELMETCPEPDDNVQRARWRQCIHTARTKLLADYVCNDERKQDKDSRKLRSLNQHVKFAVGMIMRHKKYDYTCVISGWDPTCAATESWKLHMGVQSLPRGDQQPFYHVLVHDGSTRYAAEENMVFEPDPKEITHPEVGRFFDEYCGTHYKMNNERAKDYPEDEAAVMQYVVKEKYKSENNV